SPRPSRESSSSPGAPARWCAWCATWSGCTTGSRCGPREPRRPEARSMSARSRPDYERRLAELAVRVGANVQPGQDVAVLAMDVEMAPVARAVVEAAYTAGARIVSLVYWDAHAKRSRLLHAPDESIGIVPDWYQRLGSESVENRGAQIILWGDPN